MTDIRVRTVEVDPRSRQIAAHRRSSASWVDRRGEVEAALVEVVRSVVTALDRLPPDGGWRPSKVQTTFGVTVLDDGGVLLSGRGDDTAFQVEVTFDRDAASSSAGGSAVDAGAASNA